MSDKQGKLCSDSPTVREIRRRLAGIAISTAVVLLGASAANAQSGSASATAPVTIRVAGGPAVTPDIPFFVALKQGYYKDAGLNVVYTTINGGAAPMGAALRANQVDIGLGGTIQYMDYQARGLAPGKIIAELLDNSTSILAVKGITDLEQLKGKLIGISSYNAGDQLYIQTLLDHYGIGKDDVTWVPIGDPPSRLAALIATKVDAISESANAIPESAKGFIIAQADDSPVPQVSNTLFATQAILTSNKPALVKLVAAMNKGTAWMRAHPADAVTICVDTGSDAGDCKIAIDALSTSKNPYTWSATSRVNTAVIKTMIPLLYPDGPQVKNMTVADFVDTSIAGEGAP